MDDNVSKEERLGNLYMNLYRKRIERISLDIKTNNLIKEEKGLNNKKNKFKRVKIYNKLIGYLYGLIISLLVVGYILLFIKVPILLTLPKTFYSMSLITGVLSLSLIGAFLASKIDNKRKIKNKRNEMQISKELDIKSNEITKNKERMDRLTRQINGILKEIQLLEGTKKVDEVNIYEEELDINKQYDKVYTRKRML